MIIKLIDGKLIRVPDDAVVFETHLSYNFMKPGTQRGYEPDSMYFVIPVRQVLYIRVEGCTEGFEGAVDLYVVEDTEK